MCLRVSPQHLGVRVGVERDNEGAQEPREGCANPKELQAPSSGLSQPHPPEHLTGCACVCVCVFGCKLEG